MVAAWNLVDMDKLAQGAPLTMRAWPSRALRQMPQLQFNAWMTTHGNPMRPTAMGSPRYPTPAQIAALNSLERCPRPKQRQIWSTASLEAHLPVNGLAVMRFCAVEARDKEHRAMRSITGPA